MPTKCHRAWESRHPARGRLRLHRHRYPFAALVLEGDYDELSVDGRFRCGPGSLIVHPAHHAHADAFGTKGARVLNVPLDAALDLSLYRVMSPSDPSAIERAMRCDPRLACNAILDQVARTVSLHRPAWLSRMAALLRRAPAEGGNVPIAQVSRAVGRTPEHASRSFKQYFGTGPSAYRREYRLRYAVQLIDKGHGLGEAAAAAGFADQSHLGRTLKRATGRTPRSWQRGAGDEA